MQRVGSVTTINMNTGEVTSKRRDGLLLLPARPGVCPLCAVDHTNEAPHDAQSLFYRTRFLGKYGREPRWSDALAHMTGERTVWNWVMELRRRGLWTAEDDLAMNNGTAIAEPIPTPQAPGGSSGQD